MEQSHTDIPEEPKKGPVWREGALPRGAAVRRSEYLFSGSQGPFLWEGVEVGGTEDGALRL